VTRFVYDPENPSLVFAVTPDTILLSEDSGSHFEPAFSTGTEIYDLGLSAEAAVIATSDGVQVATSNGVIPVLKGKQVIGAAPWRDGRIVAATTEALYEADLQGGYRMIAQTHPSDPFIGLGGNSELAWAITPTTVLRIGDPIAYDRRPGYKPPRMLMTSIQVERQVVKSRALPPAGELYLHPRWYAQLMPELWFSMRGGLFQQNRLLFDGEFPVSYRFADAYNQSRFGYEVTLRWYLPMAVFGEDSNVVHPGMVIDSNLRNGLDMSLRQIRSHYRQARSLVERLKNPPSDPAVDFYWRMRLEELASYLEHVSGKQVVADIDLETLE